MFGISTLKLLKQGQGPGSVKSNGREPRSCLGRVYNFKLGIFAL
jgi:hypothetical protein